MKFLLRFSLLAVLAVAGLYALDLAAVRAERDPNKRSQLALTYAEEQLKTAREGLDKGQLEDFHTGLDQVVAGVRLSDDSVRASGKVPSKSPKHFKRAEMKIRDLLRRLRSLEEQVSIDDREPINKARAQVREIHDNLVLDIVGRR
jgi:hypothetical protein